MGVGAGYFTRAVCQDLENLGVKGVMGYRTPNHKSGFFYKRDYEYAAYRGEYHRRQRFNVAVGIPRALASGG